MLQRDISSIVHTTGNTLVWQTVPMLQQPSSEALAAWLRLSTEPGLGPIQSHRLLSLFQSPQLLYSLPKHYLQSRLSEKLALQLSQPPVGAQLRLIDAALAWLEQPNHQLLTPEHPHYPALLKEIPDHPVVLYAWGNLTRLQNESIAIVGARNATPDGRDHARAFAHHLSEQNWCVVSGLAHGIDAAAHEGALSAGQNAGGTIAVLGTGIDIFYPSSHRALTEKIISEQGLILSELALGAPPLARHFPRRNRIVAGLTRGVLVVEAACKSGSLITARLAAEMGREVFAIPGSIHAPLSRGPHALIQQGAKLVENGADILSELGHVQASPLPQRLTGTKEISGVQSVLWPDIGYAPVTEEVLVQRSGLSPACLHVELLSLELNGLIRRDQSGRISKLRGQDKGRQPESD